MSVAVIADDIAALDRTYVREQLFLLAHDEEHKFRLRIHAPALGIGLAGAALVDLLIAERIHLTGGRIFISNHYDRSSTQDPVNDYVLNLLRSRPAVPLLELLKGLGPAMYERTRGALIADGVLAETGRWRRHHTLLTPSAVIRVRAKARRRVDGHGDADIHTDALCALVSALNLHGALLFWQTRAEVEPRLQGITADIPRLAARGSPVIAIPDISAAVQRAVGDISTAAL